MKIPKKLSIGGHTVKVVLKELNEIDGEFDKETNTIYVDPRLSESQQAATLLHEIFHAMNSEFEGVNHVLMESLSQQLFQVLRDNKINFGG